MNQLKELFLRAAPQSMSPTLVKALVKFRASKLAILYVKWYVAGSNYKLDYTALMHKRSRLFMAYDGALEMDREDIMSHRGWVHTAWFMSGKIHPTVFKEIVTDYKHEYRLDYSLLQLADVLASVKKHFTTRWTWYIMYAQLIIWGNAI